MTWPDVPCETCKADAGTPCKTMVGRHAGKSHAAREEAARARELELMAAGVADFGAARARRDRKNTLARRAAQEGY